VPFVVVQNPGHFNLHQFGAYDLFENAGTPKDKKWMIIGPAEYELPCYHWQLEALAFFDHLLYGAANGYANQPPVRYWKDGAEAHGSAADFPIPGSAPEWFYLAASGADPAVHRLRVKDDETGANSWAATPLGAIVTAGFDTVANQLVSYEAVMNEDTEFSGPITASLKFSSSEIDSHVVARLGRVDRAGVYHSLSLGTIRPALRKINTKRSTATEIAIDTDTPEPLSPNEPVALKFSLTPQPVLLRAAGERLRFDVSSRTDLLLSDQSHGRAQFQMQVPPYFSRNTLHYGAETYVELSRVPTQAE
jgi:predicted acyl esterase